MKFQTEQSESKRQSEILKYLRKTYPGSVVWKMHEDYVFGVKFVPDILFAYSGLVWFFEVKRPGEKPSPGQETVMNKLKLNGISAEVVYSVVDVIDILRKS